MKGIYTPICVTPGYPYMGYYIDHDGNKKELFAEKLYLINKNLVELVLPENCTYCECQHNVLTKLIVNPNCEELHCQYNKLSELILPESCKYCVCYANFNNFLYRIITYNNELSNYIFMMENRKLCTMLTSQDEETFELALQILENKLLQSEDPYEIKLGLSIKGIN